MEDDTDGGVLVGIGAEAAYFEDDLLFAVVVDGDLSVGGVAVIVVAESSADAGDAGGEVFSAEEALALGIVDTVVPTGDGPKAAAAAAERVLARGPRATELTKMMVNAAEGEETERVIEALAGTLAAGSDELAEGLAAFREKRKPRFGGTDA